MSLVYYHDFEIFRDYFYINVGKFSNLLNLHGSIKNIPDFQNKKSIVIDAASDPWGLDWVKNLVEPYQQAGIITAVLINDKEFAEQNQNLNFRFFPIWAYRYSQWAQQYETVEFFNSARRYKVSCLNRVARIHRAYTFYLIQQMPWYDRSFVSFYGLNSVNPEKYAEVSLSQVEEELGSDVADFFRRTQNKYPFTHQTDYQWENCHHATTEAYADSYSNLCTETAVNTFCPTEKTFKCIASGSLIFPVASQNFVSSMKNLGLDIDYAGLNLSLIDSVVNWKSRTKLTVDLVNQLHDSIPDIWQQNRHRLIHNQNVIKSQELQKSLLTNIKDHLC